MQDNVIIQDKTIKMRLIALKKSIFWKGVHNARNRLNYLNKQGNFMKSYENLTKCYNVLKKAKIW